MNRNVINQFPPEQIELLQAIYDVRVAQKEYFKVKTGLAKKKAMALEAKLDKILKPYVDYGLVMVTKHDAATTNDNPQLF